MKSGRGLFQLWFIGTAIWMVGWIILINQSCAPLPNGQLVCRPEFLTHLAGLTGATGFTFLELAVWGLSIPVVVLVAGIVAFRVFRSRTSN